MDAITSSDVASAPRVFLAMGHLRARKAFAAHLQSAGLRLAGQGGAGPRTLQLVSSSLPDVVVCHVPRAGRSAILLCRRITAQHPTIRTLVLTAHLEPTATRTAALAGASGYLPMAVRNVDLIETIRRAAAGQRLLEPLRPVDLIPRGPAGFGPGPAALEADQQILLPLVALGLSDPEIAARLGVGVRTISRQVRDLVDRLSLTC